MNPSLRWSLNELIFLIVIINGISENHENQPKPNGCCARPVRIAEVIIINN